MQQQQSFQVRSFRTFIVAVAIIVVMVMLGAIGFYTLENHYRSMDDEIDPITWIEAFYFIMATVTTTGYGDITPMYHITKLYTALFMIISLLILAMVGAIALAYIIEGHLRETVRRRQMKRQLESMKDHFILCGMGRVGLEVLGQFREYHQDYVVIDESEETLLHVTTENEVYVVGDATQDEVLLEAGIERARGLIACIPSDANNVFTVLTARGLNPDLQIIARGVTENSRVKLLRAGANRVVLPSHIGGMRMATLALRPRVVDFLDQTMTMSDSSEPLLLEEVPITQGCELDGKRLCDSGIKSQTGVTVLGVKQTDGSFSMNPSSEFEFMCGQVLIGIGFDKQFEALRKMVGVPDPHEVL